MIFSSISFTFEINLFTIIAFLTGIFAGGALLGLFYVFSCLKSLKKKSIQINKEINNITENDIKNIISKYQEDFEDEKKRRKSIPVDYFKTTIWAMMNEIAGKFYPKSHHPLTELSINEFILLDRYIIAKIEELFSHKGLSLFKGLKLSTIMKLMKTKAAVDNNIIVKKVKRYRLKQIASVISSALNVINPYYWIKKLIINPSINLLINKICLVCFSIVGEETYKVYSKQAFLEMESQLKDLLETIEKDDNDENTNDNAVSEEIVK